MVLEVNMRPIVLLGSSVALVTAIAGFLRTLQATTADCVSSSKPTSTDLGRTWQQAGCDGSCPEGMPDCMPGSYVDSEGYTQLFCGCGPQSPIGTKCSLIFGWKPSPEPGG